MSTLKKKELAFEKLAAIENEEAIEKVLNFLDSLIIDAKPKVYNLSKHYENVSAQYNETLQKLAQ